MIVLFDEVEKATPTVIRMLLQIMDNGSLRVDSGNETVSFRNRYAFMPSNLGPTPVAGRRVGRRRSAAHALERTAAECWPRRGRDRFPGALVRRPAPSEFKGQALVSAGHRPAVVRGEGRLEQPAQPAQEGFPTLTSQS